MIKPELQDDAFLANVSRASMDNQDFRLWWLGQSGFLVQWQGRHLLLDPYLSDSLTGKYANTDKPHVRMTARVIAPERLNFIDVVTSSHNHTDHLDADTLRPLFQVNPGLQLVLPDANIQFAAERLGQSTDKFVGVTAGKGTEVGAFRFTGIPAAHETLEKDEQGRCRFLGYIVEFGPWTIYHSGDTVRYDGMIGLLSRWQIDLALLPINGRNPARRVAGNLDGAEAAGLAKAIAARMVIPCHYEMFEFNTASPEEFVRTAAQLNQAACVLRCGQHWSSTGL